MNRTLILSLILMFSLGARATDSHSIEDIDRHYQSIQKTHAELLQSESMILKALKLSSLSEPLIWRLARTYHKLGNKSTEAAAKNYFQRCIEQADQAIQLNNRSAWGYFYRALCRGKLGEMQGIWKSLAVISPLKQDLMTAVKFDPSVAQGGPHRALGKLYLELPGILGGSVDKSVNHLKKAVALGPVFADNYLFLAEALYEQENYRAAKNTLGDLLKTIEKSSDTTDARQIRKEVQTLMEKINPWIEAQTSDAQRDKN